MGLPRLVSRRTRRRPAISGGATPIVRSVEGGAVPMVDLNADAAVGTVTSECAHHWRIETPAGEVSMGVCKHCGLTRPFANYSERKPSIDFQGSRKTAPSSATLLDLILNRMRDRGLSP